MKCIKKRKSSPRCGSDSEIFCDARKSPVTFDKYVEDMDSNVSKLDNGKKSIRQKSVALKNGKLISNFFEESQKMETEKSSNKLKTELNSKSNTDSFSKKAIINEEWKKYMVGELSPNKQSTKVKLTLKNSKSRKKSNLERLSVECESKVDCANEKTKKDIDEPVNSLDTSSSSKRKSNSKDVKSIDNTQDEFNQIVDSVTSKENQKEEIDKSKIPYDNFIFDQERSNDINESNESLIQTNCKLSKANENVAYNSENKSENSNPRRYRKKSLRLDNTDASKVNRKRSKSETSADGIKCSQDVVPVKTKKTLAKLQDENTEKDMTIDEISLKPNEFQFQLGLIRKSLPVGKTEEAPTKKSSCKKSKKMSTDISTDHHSVQNCHKIKLKTSLTTSKRNIKSKKNSNSTNKKKLAENVNCNEEISSKVDLQPENSQRKTSTKTLGTVHTKSKKKIRVTVQKKAQKNQKKPQKNVETSSNMDLLSESIQRKTSTTTSSTDGIKSKKRKNITNKKKLPKNVKTEEISSEVELQSASTHFLRRTSSTTSNTDDEIKSKNKNDSTRKTEPQKKLNSNDEMSSNVDLLPESTQKKTKTSSTVGRKPKKKSILSDKRELLRHVNCNEETSNKVVLQSASTHSLRRTSSTTSNTDDEIKSKKKSNCNDEMSSKVDLLPESTQRKTKTSSTVERKPKEKSILSDKRDLLRHVNCNEETSNKVESQSERTHSLKRTSSTDGTKLKRKLNSTDENELSKNVNYTEEISSKVELQSESTNSLRITSSISKTKSKTKLDLTDKKDVQKNKKTLTDCAEGSSKVILKNTESPRRTPIKSSNIGSHSVELNENVPSCSGTSSEGTDSSNTDLELCSKKIEETLTKYSAMYNLDFRYPILKLERDPRCDARSVTDLKDIKGTTSSNSNQTDESEHSTVHIPNSIIILKDVQLVLSDIRNGEEKRKIVQLNRNWDLTKFENRSKLGFRYKLNNPLTSVTSRNDIFCEAQLTEGFSLKSPLQSPLIFEQVASSEVFNSSDCSSKRSSSSSRDSSPNMKRMKLSESISQKSSPIQAECSVVIGSPKKIQEKNQTEQITSGDSSPNVNTVKLSETITQKSSPIQADLSIQNTKSPKNLEEKNQAKQIASRDSSPNTKRAKLLETQKFSPIWAECSVVIKSPRRIEEKHQIGQITSRDSSPSVNRVKLSDTITQKSGPVQAESPKKPEEENQTKQIASRDSSPNIKRVKLSETQQSSPIQAECSVAIESFSKIEENNQTKQIKSVSDLEKLDIIELAESSKIRKFKKLEEPLHKLTEVSETIDDSRNERLSHESEQSFEQSETPFSHRRAHENKLPAETSLEIENIGIPLKNNIFNSEEAVCNKPVLQKTKPNRKRVPTKSKINAKIHIGASIFSKKSKYVSGMATESSNSKVVDDNEEIKNQNIPIYDKVDITLKQQREDKNLSEEKLPKTCGKYKFTNQEDIKLNKKKKYSEEKHNDEDPTKTTKKIEFGSVKESENTRDISLQVSPESSNQSTSKFKSPEKLSSSVNLSSSSQKNVVSESSMKRPSPPKTSSEKIEVNSNAISTLPKPRHTFKFENSAIKRPPSRMPKKIKLNRPTHSPDVFKVPLSPVQSKKSSANPTPNASPSRTSSIPNCQSTFVKLEKDSDSISIYAETIGNESTCSFKNNSIIDNDDNEDEEEDETDLFKISPVPLEPTRHVDVNEWVDNTVKICESINQAIEKNLSTCLENVETNVCPEILVGKEEIQPEIENTKEKEISVTENKVEEVSLPIISQPGNCTKAMNLFNSMCHFFKISGECRRPFCKFKHNFPLNWKEELLKLPYESVLTLYDYIKKTKLIYLYKEIFHVIAEYFGTKRDFTNLLMMVKDVIETDISSDRAPYISTIINVLCKPGVTFHSMVEVIYKHANVSPNFVDLLSDILLTLIIEKRDCDTNWVVIKELFENKNYDVDFGIIRALIVECLQMKQLRKELFLKVYHDIIKKVENKKLSQINESILNNFHTRLLKFNLTTEATEYFNRCQEMNIILGTRSDHSNSPASSTPGIYSMTSSPTVKVSPIRNVANREDQPKNTSILLNASYVPLKPQFMQPAAALDFDPASSFTANILPQVYPVSPLMSTSYSVPNLTSTPKITVENCNTTQFSHPPARKSFKKYVNASNTSLSTQVSSRLSYHRITSEIKKVLYEKSDLGIFDLLLNYKDGHLTDIFLKELIEIMTQNRYHFAVTYSHLWHAVMFSNKLEDKNLKFMLKALGANLIMHLASKCRWNEAISIYSDLKNHFDELDDIVNVKFYLEEKYSYFKRILIIIEMHIRKIKFNTAWSILKEHAFQENTYKGHITEAEVSYRNKLIDELLTSVIQNEAWRTGLDIVKYVITNKISDIEVKKYTNEIFRQAVNSECELNDIKAFINCSEYWFKYINCNTIRAFATRAVACEDWELAKQVYNIGANTDLYPNLIGPERILTFPLYYVLEEIWLIFEIYFENMTRVYPIPHNINIRIADDTRIHAVEDLPKNLQQFNMTATTIKARIGNILSNCIKPAVSLITQNKSLILTAESVNKHLEARILRRESETDA